VTTGLRPWQHATAARLLEVDADGLWCWGIRGALVVVPRQQGKTTFLNLLATWMAHEVGVHVLSSAPVLRQVWDLIQPTFDWIEDPDSPDLAVRASRQSDRPSIRFFRDGQPHGRWSCQAASLRLGVGSSVDAALLDEVWDLNADSVLRGLLPSMSARPNPFLLMASTSDVEGSGLMRRWRAAAMATPERVALVEWGAPADTDWTEVDTWRAASAHWDAGRQRILEAQRDLMPELHFRTQYLNQEPRAVGIQGWVSLAGLAEASPVPLGPVYAALEEQEGRWVLAWAWRHQEKVHVRVEEVGSSLRKATEAAAGLSPVAVLVHRVTARRLTDPDWPMVSVTATDHLAATRAMEAMVADGRLAYAGDLLERQVTDARLGSTGALDRKASQGPIHAVQAAVWAAYAAEKSDSGHPEVF